MEFKGSPERPAAHRSTLAKAGIIVGEVIGSGFEGVVFKAPRPGAVIKTTDHCGELQFFAWLASLGGHPGFPTPIGAAEIGKYSGHKLYAIEREDVPDLQLADSQRFHRAVDELLASATYEPPSFAARSFDAVRWQQRTAEALSNVDPRDAWAVTSHADTLAWALAQGCHFEELHEHNLAARGKQVVIRDLGAAWVPRGWKYPVPKMQPKPAA